MAFYFEEPSRTFNEYLLVPGYSSAECRAENVSLKTPLVKFKKGEEPALSLNVPLVSAIMQAVSDDNMAIALAKEGGVSFIYGSQSIESQAAMVRRVKNYKAGFVPSDSNLSPESTLKDVLDLKEKTGHSTMAVTADGTANGKLLGVVTGRDYRISRLSMDTKVETFMTPYDKLICANLGTSLKECNDMIWDNKLNALPVVDAEQRLHYFVFRKDYENRKNNPNELLDENKRYIVGAGINTRDYATRVPALVEAGADVLCIDSSEGFSEWQKLTIDWIRENYGDTVKVGAAVYLGSEEEIIDQLHLKEDDLVIIVSLHETYDDFCTNRSVFYQNANYLDVKIKPKIGFIGVAPKDNPLYFNYNINQESFDKSMNELQVFFLNLVQYILYKNGI